MVDDEDEGVILTPDVALAEAANALTAAAAKAEFLNDTESLMKIAGGWLEIHEYMTGTPHENRKLPLGFVSSKHTEQEEEEEELDDAIADEPGEPEGRSASRVYLSGVHSQHGKFRITPRRYRN